MSFKQLTWGVKASFRAYVEAAGGSIKLGDGATSTDEGEIVFEAVPGGDLSIAEDGSATGSMRFKGTVNFEAHGGMLNSTLTELGIDAGPDGLALTVLEMPGDEDRCEVAKLFSAEDSSAERTILRSEITMDGMYQIADNYPPGTELDLVYLD